MAEQGKELSEPAAGRLSVAPMMDWTDRHCRAFHRRFTRRTLLYTEMVTTGAILNGPRERLLAHGAEEHPLALQLGGSDPADLAAATRIDQLKILGAEKQIPLRPAIAQGRLPLQIARAGTVQGGAEIFEVIDVADRAVVNLCLPVRRWLGLVPIGP